MTTLARRDWTDKIATGGSACNTPTRLNTPALEDAGMSEKESTVEYREIPDYPGYRIGSDGTVWSQLECRFIGSSTYGKKWRKMIPDIDRDGYGRVKLCSTTSRRRARVHRLILEIFIGPCPPGMCGAHENGDPADNRLINLSWKSQKDNISDKIRHGTSQIGMRHPFRKLSDDQVREIRARRADGEFYSVICKDYGIGETTVRDIVRRRTWSHL